MEVTLPTRLICKCGGCNEPMTGTSDIAWIAGVGASAGLGAALARRFAQGGLKVALTGRSPERLGGAVEALGPLRAAIFNAGNAVRGALLEITPEQFETAWRGSAYAGFLFAQAALPHLLAAGGGSLLVTGATASIRGRGPFTAFAAAKAALRSLAQSLAREYGPLGVHVAHIVIDGGINGERLRRNAPERVAQAGSDGLLRPDAIAETYWQLHVQHRSAWTHELDLRPYVEPF